MTQQQREAVAGIVRNSELLGRAHMNSKSAVPAGRSGASRRNFPVRARDLLKVRAVWILPLILGSTVVVLITAFYVGSVVNPLGHLQGLPVAVVNQDRGAVIGTRQVNIGQQIQRGLSGSTAVSGRLALTDTSLRLRAAGHGPRRLLRDGGDPARLHRLAAHPVGCQNCADSRDLGF